MRGDVRKMIPATMNPRASHTTCRCQIVATNVGTSVWPAEYRVASPYSASKTTETNNPLSSWRTRVSTVDPDVCRVGQRGNGRHGIGQHRNLEWRGRGVVGHRDPHLRRGALVDAEVMRDGPRHQRHDGGAVAREFDDRAYHDLRLVGRRKTDKPAVIEPVGILRRSRFTGDL